MEVKTYHCKGFDLESAKDTYKHFRGKLFLLRDYGDVCNGHCLHSWDDGWRRLYRCLACGGLILVQRSEFHDDDYDDYYTDYFPVDSEEEAQKLNEEYGGYDLEIAWTGKGVFLKNVFDTV